MYIEQNSRFAHSKLWDLQKSAYSQFGPQAWDHKKVPSYITSSPMIARAYANITLGFIRDGLSSQAILPIDPAQPLYIFDLGAGTGRFGYLFLHYFISLLDELKIPLSIRYVMTDLTLKNLDYLQNHAYLKPLTLKYGGCLDFCLFQHDQEKPEIQLIQRQKILHANSFNNPLILIGNYFFDTLPHDLFRVQNHKLEDGRISLTYAPPENTPGVDFDNPLIIPFLKMETTYFPLEKWDPIYLENPLWIEILNEYAIQYEQIPQLLFPFGAFQVIQRFLKLSNYRFLFLAGDQGIHSTSQLNEELPFFSQHDTFSIQVNYHAIATYFKKIEAACWTTANPDPIMVNMAATSKGSPTQFPELSKAFKQNLKAFELSDYYRLTDNILELGDAAPLELILKLIKLGNFDPCDVHLFYPTIMQKLQNATPKIYHELMNMITQVGKHVYPISPEGGAFVMNLGVLCFHMKQYKQSLYYFQKALEMGYDDPLVFKNISAVRSKI